MSPILLIYFAAVAGLALFGLHRFFLLVLYWRVRNRRPQETVLEEGDLPFVTLQLPLFNERYVARRLAMAAARLDYPRDRLQIQLLDDSTDETRALLAKLTRRLQRVGIPIEHIHREDRSGFKAGALAEGLGSARGSLVAMFDADFIPPTEFLRKIVPYFKSSDVGMVQARWGHLNREYSLLTRLQSIFLDGHFHIEHVARNRTGRFFNFNGTAGVWRRECIDDAGGWQGDTLTEDLDLSYRAQIKGWRFVYLDDLSSDAELPIDMNAFKAQQHRWAKGSIQTARKILPLVLRSSLPWRVKVEAVLHLTNNMTYLLMAIPCFLWVPTLSARFDTDRPWMIAFATAMALTTLCVGTYHVVCQRAAGRSTWSTIKVMPALLSLGIGLSMNNGRAVMEALLGHRSPFMRTPKYGEGGTKTRRSFAYGLRHHWLTWLELALAGYFGVGLIVAVQSQRYVAIPFLLLFLAGFTYVGLSSLGRQMDRLLSLASLVACLSLLAFGLWVGRALLAFAG